MTWLRHNLEAYREAHRLIWREGLWRWMVLPVLLTMAYLPLLVLGGLALGEGISGWLVDLLPWLGDYRGWVYWPMRVLLFLLFALFGYFSYRIVVMLLYLPMMEFIAEGVERRVLGEAEAVARPWYAMVGRILGIVSLTLLLSAGLLVLNLAASLIPVVGTLVALACILPFQFFLTAVGYLDPYLDRRGYTVRESLRLLWRHFPTVVGFDLLGTGLLLIPIVGWFLGPTYAVVAGILMGMRLHRRPVPGRASPPAGPRPQLPFEGGAA
jgi:CysZ protein